MNKKIITFLCATISTLSHSMEKENKLIQISYQRYNTPDIDKRKNFSHAKKLLDQKKAHPDARTSAEHPTPLMLAIYHQDPEYAQLLLQYGADPYKKGLYPGKTKQGSINCFQMILDDNFYQQIKDSIIKQANLQDNSLLNKIARKRSKPKYISHREINLTIAHRLLENGADPDFRSQPNDPTSLMIAVCGKDKIYAHLLLWYNADPYKKGMWINSTLKNSFEIEKERNNCCEKNAFEMESTGWLQRMVDERKNIILNCAWFKLYSTQPECTLLPELVQLIIYNTWYIGKTYNEK